MLVLGPLLPCVLRMWLQSLHCIPVGAPQISVAGYNLILRIDRGNVVTVTAHYGSVVTIVACTVSVPAVSNLIRLTFPVHHCMPLVRMHLSVAGFNEIFTTDTCGIVDVPKKYFGNLRFYHCTESLRSSWQVCWMTVLSPPVHSSRLASSFC